MSSTAARVGIGIVLVLLAGAAALVASPFGAGLVRVHGLSVLWWYAGIVAPALAVLVAIVALRRPAPRSVVGGPAPPA